MAGDSTAQPDYSILAAFQGPMTRPRTSWLYRGGLVMVTATMLLLPVVYLGLVGLTSYGVYHHAFHHWGQIMNFGGYQGGVRLMIFKLAIYFTPLLAGLVVLLFMFKPLLAGRPKHVQPLALNPAHEPLIYAFIEKVCDVVEAPSPCRIELDCQLNAAAGFRRGFFSLFSNDLVLVIGLPLVANLTAREFAGVIAHEFGHFTQGAGMRFSYVVRSIIRWFGWVAYERDAWDEALERWSMEETDGRVTLVVWMVQLAVWFSRLILKSLMFVGILVAGFMLRQMEYDADAYGIKVAGSEAFEQTQRKLATLGAAMAQSDKQMVATWRKNKTLPDNLPELLRASHQRLPPPLLQKINDTLGLHRTGLFDSHPSPADRIRQARQAADPGIFHDERPASSLFTSFEHPSRFVTLLHYTEDLGIPITEQMLTRVETSRPGLDKPPAPATAGQAGDRYFFGITQMLRPLHLNSPSPSADLEADYAEMSQLTAGLQQHSRQLEAAVLDDTQLSDRLASARAAQQVLNHEVVLQPDILGPAGMTAERAVALQAEIVASKEDLRNSLRQVFPALKRRLELGLSLALANAGESDTQSQAQKAAPLVSWLNQEADHCARRLELSEALAVLDKLSQVKSAQGECPLLARAWAEQTQAVRRLAEPPGGPGQPAPKTRLRIQLGKSGSGADLAAIQEQNRQWLRAYDQKLDELVRIAESVDSFTRA